MGVDGMGMEISVQAPLLKASLCSAFNVHMNLKSELVRYQHGEFNDSDQKVVRVQCSRFMLGPDRTTHAHNTIGK